MANTGCDLGKCGVPLGEVEMTMSDISSTADLESWYTINGARNFGGDLGKAFIRADSGILSHIQPDCQKTRNGLVYEFVPVLHRLREATYGCQPHS